ncbi:unnamed protein product [Cunninghamella echinulata]
MNTIIAPIPQTRKESNSEKYLSVMSLNNIPSPTSSAASSDREINERDSDEDSEEVTVISPPLSSTSSSQKKHEQENETLPPPKIIEPSTPSLSSSSITNSLLSEKIPSTTAINTTHITTDSSSSKENIVYNNKNSNNINKAIPKENLRQGKSQMDILWNEMESIQYKNKDNDYEEDTASEYDSEEEEDDELKKVTEANRHIVINDTNYDDNQAVTSTMKQPLDNKETEYERVVRHYNSVKKRQKKGSIHNHNIYKNLLVFGDSSTERTISAPNQKSKELIYGAGIHGNQVIKNDVVTTLNEEEMGQKSYKRKYLVACDFSDESLYAMEWAMGTILRDNDELHIVTVSNLEDNSEALKQSSMSLEQEVDLTLEAAIKETKKRLVKMMLYDIKIVFHAMIGRVKDAIKSLIYNIPLTMVVCGCRGRGTMKGMIMGSVSTYLVHKSIVPVTVVRQNKKKKVHRRHLITATPLSESVRTGNLQVDELKK